MQVDRNLFEAYMQDLQIPSGLATGFEDEAFAVVYGLTRIRQVPYDARQQWFEAQRKSSQTTPDWVLALPNEGGGPRSPEYRWSMIMDRVGTLALGAYGGGIDDKSLQTPRLKVPWSLWPFEFEQVAPRVLGAEGGSVATGQTYITPGQVLKAPGAAVGYAQQRGLDALRKLSPGGMSVAQAVKDSLDEAEVTKYVTAFGVFLFGYGVRKMAPQLAAMLAEAGGYLTTAEKAIKAWPAIVVAMVAAGVWDLETLQANTAAVNAYRRDKARRDLEGSTGNAQSPSPQQSM